MAFSAIQCYKGTTSPEYPCGNLNTTNPIVACCPGGTLCVSGGLCQYPDTSQYFIGGCTSDEITAPGCPNKCLNQYALYLDTAYNSSINLWQCCSDGSCLNPNPNNETFSAPPPSELEVIFSVPKNGWTATSTSISSSSTSTPLPVTVTVTSIPSTSAATTTSSSTTQPSSPTSTRAAPTSSTQASSALSSGAAAGIGVGVTLAALGAIALLAFLILRRRKQKRMEGQQEISYSTHGRSRHDNAIVMAESQAHDSGKQRPPELGSTPLYELDKEGKPHEVGNDRAELPGTI